MRKINYMIIALALSFMMFSCQMEDNPIGMGDSDGDATGAITSVLLPAEVVDNINSADLSTPFENDFYDYSSESMLMGGRDGKKPPKGYDKKGKKVKKDDLRDDLGLTDEQKAAIEQARIDYIACSEAYRMTIMEIHKAIFESANAQRMDIMTQLRAGDITKEEARALLTALRESIKAELENNAEFQAAVEGLKGCQEALKAAIDSILTDEQKAKLQERSENRKDFRKDGHKKHDRDGDHDDDDDDDDDDNDDDDDDDDDDDSDTDPVNN